MEPLYGKWSFDGVTINLDIFDQETCVLSGSSSLPGYSLRGTCCFEVVQDNKGASVRITRIYRFTFTGENTVSGHCTVGINGAYDHEFDFNGIKIEDYDTTTTTTSIESTTSTSSIASSTTSTVSATTTSSIPITTTSINITTTSTTLITTSVNPTTTTYIDNGCPPDYPIDCGDGTCCPLSHPVCGRGFYYDYCFEAGTNPNCPALTLYGEDSQEIELLRYYRDNVLSQTPEGRELIKLYYLWSPVIVWAMEGDEEFKGEVKELIDGVLPMIEVAVD